MKLLITGGRDFTNWNLFQEVMVEVEREFYITTIAHGAAKGADSLAQLWADRNHVKCLSFPADWKNLKAKGAVIKKNKYGSYNSSAGITRNYHMFKQFSPEMVIGFQGGLGTKNMVNLAVKEGVYTWHVQKDKYDSIIVYNQENSVFNNIF